MVDINLIPKEYRKKKQDILIVFSKTGGAIVILFVLSLLLYGGLLLYQNQAEADLNNIKEEIMNLYQSRDPEIESAIVNLDKKLGIVKELFDNHVYWSKLFNKIEGLTIPEVYFSDAKLNFSSEDVNVVFSGNALSYTVLARQVLSFQDDSLVEEVRVSGISLGTIGGIDFDLSIIFSKNILLNHD